MKLISPTFSHYANIPVRYTCDGKNISPLLEWTEVPSHTKSLVLIMDDPDAPVGTWNHWIIFNLPANLTTLPEGIKIFPSELNLGKIVEGKLNMVVLVLPIDSIVIFLSYML